MEDQVDNEEFQDLYIDSVIKKWSGLKYKYLTKLMPVDISKLDPEAELNYTKENARILMKNSTEFDLWVGELLEDVENFSRASFS